MKYIFFIFFSTLLLSCNHSRPQKDRKIEKAFYYWKSVVAPTQFEKKTLDSLYCSTVYIKYFDVAWNENTQQPEPVAQVKILDTAFLKNKKIIPVIFITNECIYKLDTAQAIPLAEKITGLVRLINSMYRVNNIAQLQIDCDWTEATKNTYFSMLKKVKELWMPMPISATIRLHQVKYIGKSGVPPVNRGLLMCYNMGNLTNPDVDNSILDSRELKKYTGTLSTYPLPLDVAYPLFDWKVLFRYGKFKGLIQHLPDSVFQNSFVTKKNNTFIFLKDTLLSGYDFKKMDVLRNEKSNYKDIMSAANEISSRLTNDSLSVSLFHLDSLTLKKYPIYELENIYSSMH